MISDLISEANSRGWLLNNLFQLDSGIFQANLRSATHHTAFGRGPTAEIALSLAMDAIESAIPTPPEPTCDGTIAPAADLASILTSLRRSRPSAITRRL